MTLTEFLLARIAEDEAVARAATPGPWRVCAEGSEGSRIAPEGGTKRERSRFLGIMNGRVQPEDGRNAAHIARHDPARVLAECAAKRRIVEGMQPFGPIDDINAEEIFALLALPYADHPDYRQEWAL